MMIDFGIYPSGKFLLASLSSYPRYCGPREAVFTAICRKNMGCSHFIVGRNHAGVGDFYHDSEYRKIFDKLSDLGIIPVFFDAIGFNPKSKQYEKLKQGETMTISGSQVRGALLKNEPLPEWFMRDMIQTMLKAAIKSGQPVFHP